MAARHNSLHLTAQTVEARAQQAISRSVETSERLALLQEKTGCTLPFPFNAPATRAALERLPAQILRVTDALHQSLEPERRALRSGTLRGELFKTYLNALIAAEPKDHAYGSHADRIVDLLLETEEAAETQSLLHGTHHYTPTPVKLIPKLVEVGQLSQHDHVKDLGCGNGRLLALLHLMTGCRGSGVEILEGLSLQGEKLLRKNNLSSLSIRAGNALHENLSDATAVVLYAPFYASMFRTAVDGFEERASAGNFRIVLHGPMETFLDESPRFLRHPSSGAIRRYDAIGEQPLDLAQVCADLIPPANPIRPSSRKIRS
ncbi:MAG: hypothetical protein J0M12_11975 [Deltaproteobacteria bacterium]|nr:hypothetical protein [Deltaproteobacteria bacterium]